MPVREQELLEEARRIGGHATKKEALHAALEEYVRRRKQLRVLSHFGTVDFAPGYDYKRNRERDRLP